MPGETLRGRLRAGVHDEEADMLHMVVNTHNAESCAFRGPHEDELLSGAFDRLEGIARENGLAIEGWWVNRAAHEIFVLVDAPNGHVVEEALLTAGLVGRTHSRIMPVVPVPQAMEAEYEHAHAQADGS